MVETAIYISDAIPAITKLTRMIISKSMVEPFYIKTCEMRKLFYKFRKYTIRNEIKATSFLIVAFS